MVKNERSPQKMEIKNTGIFEQSPQFAHFGNQTAVTSAYQFARNGLTPNDTGGRAGNHDLRKGGWNLTTGIDTKPIAHQGMLQSAAEISSATLSTNSITTDSIQSPLTSGTENEDTDLIVDGSKQLGQEAVEKMDKLNESSKQNKSGISCFYNPVKTS